LLLAHLAHLAMLHLLESVVLVDLKVLHLSLQLFVLGRKLLLLRDHAHVDILLVSSGDLLLLCLQHLDLLSELELLHCENMSVFEGDGSVIRWINAVRKRRSTYPSKASFRTGCDGGQCAGDGRPGPGDRSGSADPLYRCARMHADVVVKLFMET
jgi:hypothetical protein